MKASIVTLSCLFFASATLSHGASYTWNGDSATGGSTWSGAASKWLPSDSPSTGDEAWINKANAGKITFDINPTIAALRVGWNANGTVAFKTGEGNELTVGSAGSGGLIIIGGAETASAATGNLTLEVGVKVNLIGGSLLMGTESVSNSEPRRSARTGAISMQAGSTLNVGTIQNRSEWIMGRQNSGSHSSNVGEASTGALAADGTNKGGYVNAWLTDLEVGTNTGTSRWLETQRGVGSINFSDMQGANIDTLRLRLGTGESGGAEGLIDLGGHASGSYQFQARDEVKIGVGGISVASPNPGTGQTNNIVSGELKWGASAGVAFGTDSQEADVQIGVSAMTRGTVITVTGTVAGTGGTFSGHFSSLTIGSQNATTAGKTYKAEGVVDLREVEVTHFSVSGQTNIGYGSGNGSVGKLYLAEAAASFNGGLRVGSSDTVTGEGLLSLANTRATAKGNVYIDQSGSISVEINGSSSGLSFSDDATFGIAALSLGYQMTFNDLGSERITWGLAWEGVHDVYLQGLYDSGLISWTSNLDPSYAISIFYDDFSGTTYIGTAIPEPGTIGLAFIGAVSALGLRRRLVNRR